MALAVLAAAACKKPVNPGDPLSGLSPELLARFQAGKEVFDSTFTPTTGLGPLFNSTGCGECHEDPAAGGFGDEVEVHATAFRPGPSCDPLAGEGGPVIQQQVTPALKAALGIDSEPFPKDATGRAKRTTPVLFGRGLLDAVPDSLILSYADPDDRNHDGIRGRPNRSVDGRIGRFGRKAFVAALDEFNAGAFLAEMGVTVPAQPTEETVGGQPLPPGVDPAPDPEINQDLVNRTNDFVRLLAPPSVKATMQTRLGSKLFDRVGCAACHIPTLRTGDSPVPALSHQRFGAYTDLLLHDMGPELADICLGLAGPSDFRTEPLIGLRSGTRFLHDGRADTPERAIELHDGEAANARDRFLKLSADERAAVVAFLKSL
jgi:CxxC motif-containing protein (DUF1111 family)